MKIEQLAYRVAEEALSLLEKRYHYRIPEEHKRDIQTTVVDGLNFLIDDTKKEDEEKK